MSAVVAQEGEPAEREALTVDDVEVKAKTYRARKQERLSWDEYLQLSDRERAAVDFNTMLVQAREKDLDNQAEYSPTSAQRATYDKAVERMFGKEGASASFAPETVALLNEIGFEQTDAKRFDDLDDFLGLKAAISERQLDKIGKLNPGDGVIAEGTSSAMDQSLGGLVPVELPTETNQQVATSLAAGTDQLRESITRGNMLLQNWRGTTATLRNESLGYYGGLANENRFANFKLSDQANKLMEGDARYFDFAFDTLANPASDGTQVLSLIQKDLKEKGLLKEFMQYADSRAKYAEQAGAPLGAGNQEYRSAEEFRSILSGGGEPSGAGGE